MRIKLSVVVAVFAISLFGLNNLSAQVNKAGLPVIKSYDYSVMGGAEWNYNIVRDNRGVLYFGNEDGYVIEFDGLNWVLIPVDNNPVITSLELDPDGIVYVGGSYQFGYLDPDPQGKLKYVSLSDRLDSLAKARISDVWNIKYFNNKVHFVTKSTIFTYNKISDHLDSLNVLRGGDEKKKFFTLQEIYSVDDNLYVSDNRFGLTVLQGDSLVLLPGGENFAMDYCMSVLPFDNQQLLVGTFFRGLYLFNPETGEINDRFVSPENNELLKAHHIYNGEVLPDGNFAFGTTSGGVYIFNREGELLNLINNSTAGIDDDQVYHMLLDGEEPFSQLWMATVGSVHKVGYNLPFRVLGRANNLNSGIRDFAEFNGTVYIGGDKGVLKQSYSNNQVVFEEIAGLNDQIHSVVPYKSGNKEFLLAAGLSGLFIIDNNDNVSKFSDIMTSSDGEYNPDFVRRMINSSYHPNRFYLGLSRKLRIIEYKSGKWYHVKDITGGIQGKIDDISEESGSRIWIATSDQEKLYTIDIAEDDTLITEYTGEELDDVVINAVRVTNGSAYIATSAGIFKYNEADKKFDALESLTLNSDINYETIYPLGDEGFYIGANDYQNIDYIVRPDGSKIQLPFYLLPKTYTSNIMHKDGMLWLSKNQEIYIIDLDKIDSFYSKNDVLIRNVRIDQDSTIFGGTFFELNAEGQKIILKNQTQSMIKKINHSYNDIRFTWSSNNLVQEDSTVYSFMIENFDDDWSRFDKVYYKDYTNLPHGKYVFKIRARDVTRQVSDITIYEFEILRAWYQSLVALFVYAVLIVLAVIAIIKIYTRRLIRENLRLEGIVAERTEEVVRQKEELEDSIHYASRIQRAILPTEKSLKDKVEDYFILFRPRDIVSGDFYWVSERGPRLFIVAADCTGHGVPGAFMSILGVSFLDEIINKTDNTETNVILDRLRSHVTESLKQLEGGDEETKDGMDLGLLVINYKEEEIEFSGAYNPCWLVRELTPDEKEKYTAGELELERNSLANGEHILETIDADRMPIGVSSRMGQSFTMNKKKLEKGVSYYLLSDGYSDQFGGEKGRKFLKKNLKKLILDIQGVPMKQQRDLLEKRLIDWMGEHEQVDDILIMGIRAV